MPPRMFCTVCLKYPEFGVKNVLGDAFPVHLGSVLDGHVFETHENIETFYPLGQGDSVFPQNSGVNKNTHRAFKDMLTTDA